MSKFIKRIAVAMSGGVDSSVAALILKRKGYDVTGVYMQNWSEHDELGHCNGDQEFRDAQKVAAILDIPIRRVTFEKEYWNLVFSQVTAGYENGITPNPDILCNRHIKFGALFHHVMKNMNVDWLATGHYARLQYSKEGVRLMKAEDSNKDQTFFLGQVNPEALSRTLFPVGEILKSDVKELARTNGLAHIADKKESFGICFIGTRKFKDFINEYVSTPPGVMVDVDTGRTVVAHQGIHLWTFGQRIFLGGQSTPYYICDIDPKSNIIYVAAGKGHPSLDSHVITCSLPHWLSAKHRIEFENEQMLLCSLRTRHRAKICRCTVFYSPDAGKITVEPADPLNGLVAPGQYAVFYDGDECIGSSVILHKDKYEGFVTYDENTSRQQV